MADLNLSQPERRSYVFPVLIALLALGLAVALARHFFPATTVNIAQVRADVIPTHTIFKADSIVVGQTQTEDILYVVETLKIDNQLQAPIFLDDFTLTLTDAQGAELEVKALQKADLAGVEQSFPQLQLLMLAPLLRETSIDPGKQAQGTVLFALQVPQSLWKARKSAVVKVDLYHQHPVYQTIQTIQTIETAKP